MKNGALAVFLALLSVFAVVASGCGGQETAAELFSKGQQAFSEGRYDDAAGLYREGLEKQPDSSAGYNLLGMAYRFQNHQAGGVSHREKEEAAFRKAVELDPGNATAHVNLGATLFYAGRKEEAARYLKKALEVYPNHPDRVSIEDLIKQSESR